MERELKRILNLDGWKALFDKILYRTVEDQWRGSMKLIVNWPHRSEQ